MLGQILTYSNFKASNYNHSGILGDLITANANLDIKDFMGCSAIVYGTYKNITLFLI